MPLPGELGEQECFPREAYELIRLWINQGTRKTTNDETELREEVVEAIDESKWEIPKVRKDTLELTQGGLDYYRMQLDDIHGKLDRLSHPMLEMNFFAKGADEFNVPKSSEISVCKQRHVQNQQVARLPRRVQKHIKEIRPSDPFLAGGGIEEDRREKSAQVKLYQDQILNALTWPIFSQPQGLDYQYPNRGDFDGLFGQPHDNFHGWIGPDMVDNSYMAFDPIFWSYHANVDRIFEQYIHDHQDATFSSIFPLQPFTGARADKTSPGDPCKHNYTIIGDMTKTSLALGHPIAPPVHQDCPPKIVLYGGEGPTSGSKTPYVLFEGVKCTTESYTVDVYIDCPETSRLSSASNKHYIGRLTRMGMGDSATECLAIRDDAEAVLSQVVADIKTGETVPEEMYKKWNGFVGNLV
ncbi:hypothetical protein HOY80DRAFT_1084619 [Tuber brumale]|nr:hypothetical protein HOY80DRAFT_1084619 [Tuber brumale]